VDPPLEDAVPIRTQTCETPPARARVPLDEHVRRPAGRRPAPDVDTTVRPVGDEGKAEGGERGLRRVAGQAVAAPEVEAGLRRLARIRVVTKLQPGHERDPGAPHPVEGLCDPARVELDREHEVVEIGGIRVPGELQHPEAGLLARHDVARAPRGVEQ